jgi:hypothetical protein
MSDIVLLDPEELIDAFFEPIGGSDVDSECTFNEVTERGREVLGQFIGFEIEEWSWLDTLVWCIASGAARCSDRDHL